MNIFILSRSLAPHVHYRNQAKYHCNKHVVKMINESTQMLVTVLVQHNFPALSKDLPPALAQIPCRVLSASMTKHPCTQWVFKDIKHFNYLCRLALALCSEHQHRYPLSAEHEYLPWLQELAVFLNLHGIHSATELPTHFAVAVKSEILRSTSTPHQDAVDIYRQYYIDDKAAFAAWKNRTAPAWWPYS